jgi:L-threonylcarbamoyladenylate synthase
MTDVLPPTPDGITRAAELLRGGAVVAFPTDTVYGVAVSQRDHLPALFALKQRPVEKRIPMLVADLSQVIGADDRARALAARFWPGALTLVLHGPEDSDESQAFRAPDHPVALDLIRATGPLFATSANRSGEPDTLGADDVLIAFATQQDDLAAILDGGAVPGGVASTVVDLSVTPARILREGPITREELEPLVDLVP